MKIFINIYFHQIIKDLIGFLETTDDSKLISYSIDKRNNFNI